MLLSKLLAIDITTDVDVTGMNVDSRAIQPGDLFVALPSAHSQVQAFIADAIERGAQAVVYDKKHLFELPDTIASVGINGLSDSLSGIAQRFFSYKKDALQLIGVTGTNGKTSIAYILQQFFSLLGEPTGYIGTLGYGSSKGGPTVQLNNSGSSLTTPDILTVYKYVNQCSQDGCSNMVIEASSHGLAQNRLAGLDFAYGIFSNLSRDHFDYHTGFDDYFAAKKKLFDSTQVAIINMDDNYGRQLLAEITPAICYSVTDSEAVKGARIVYAQDCVTGLDSTSFTLCYFGESVACHTSVTGMFATSNILAACCVLLDRGYSLHNLRDVMGAIQTPPGRLELVAREPWIFIDFAHTPDALATTLQELRRITKGQLSVVFGCGGDRDRGKRAVMGQCASEIADLVYITSDNPRNEDPQVIIDHILQGVATENQSKVIVEADRARAIALAVESAQASDCLLVAGKGHETTQTIRGVVHPLSDHETVAQLVTNT